jgi:hypothetical protein
VGEGLVQQQRQALHHRLTHQRRAAVHSQAAHKPRGGGEGEKGVSGCERRREWVVVGYLVM